MNGRSYELAQESLDGTGLAAADDPDFAQLYGTLFLMCAHALANVLAMAGEDLENATEHSRATATR